MKLFAALLLCVHLTLCSKNEYVDSDVELGEEYLVELEGSQKVSRVTMLDSTWNTPRMTWKNHKTVGKFSLYPLENSVKAIRDVKTNEIVWEDSMNLIPNDVKESIDICLQKNEKAMCNRLFDRLFHWYLPREAMPFLKDLMFPMSKRVGIERRSKDGVTPLMVAAVMDANEACARLLARGANVEAVNKAGNTALHLAAYNGSQSSCKLLLEKGADVNAQNKHGNVPLLSAVGNGHVKVAKLLMSFYADTKIVNKFGRTVLNRATGSCARVIREYEEKSKKNMKM